MFRLVYVEYDPDKKKYRVDEVLISENWIDPPRLVERRYFKRVLIVSPCGVIDLADHGIKKYIGVPVFTFVDEKKSVFKIGTK